MTEKNELPLYEATVAVYVEGNLYKPGEQFSTEKPFGSTWIPLNSPAKAVAKKADKDRIADLKDAGGDADAKALVDAAVAKVRSEHAEELLALTQRAEAAEAKINAGDDAALDALAEEAKAKDAEIADLKARLKVYTDGAGEAQQTGDHGPAKK